MSLKRGDDVITLGARAAAKLLVQAVAVILSIALGAVARAQPAPAPSVDSTRPFEIQDNSFLVEEAFNQEHGIYQNIFGFVRGNDAWELAFTQEWPVGSQTHQLSYTLPFGGYGGADGLGDALLNYRYQLWLEADGRPAFSPRVSLVLPTGGASRGYDTLGYQVNLPFSKQTGDWYLHWNAGFTSFPGVESPRGDVTLFTLHLSASGIWRVRPMVHVMIETVFESEEDPAGRRALFTASPGVRLGRNFGDHQMVVGAAFPVSFYDGGSDGAVLLYLSYELPWR